MTSIWRHVEAIGRQYGVNPVVFTVLYVIHHPLFWGTMAWMVIRFRRRQAISVQVVLGVFFYLMPYAYLVVYGHGLPVWAYPLLGVLVVAGGLRAWREGRRRLGGLPLDP